MPGYINYFYKGGVTPTHCKQAFTNYSIPTVHNIITKNALLFILKTYKFQFNLPSSVCQIIPENAPTPGSAYDDSETVVWMSIYNTSHFRASLYYKGSLFYAEIIVLIKSDYNTFQSHKTAIKTYLHKLQSTGNSDVWIAENFKLFHPKGLRQSNRIA